MQQNLGEFKKRGVEIVAISVDSPERNREHTAKQGYTYTFLSDEDLKVISRYDLVHEGGRMGEADIARPAEFLIDSTGTVRWANLTADYRVRARPEQFLRVIDELSAARPD